MAHLKPVPAYVSPAVLQWARNRAGLSLDVLAGKAKVAPERLAAWEGAWSIRR